MGKTSISIENESFEINGALIYSEISSSKPEAHGLLMNARFIQGIFDDKADPDRFARWGNADWNPSAHTQALVDALDKANVDFRRVVLPCGHYTLGRPPFYLIDAYLIVRFFRRHLGA